MKNFNPNDIAKWCNGSWDMLPAMPISGVSKDTRTLRPGELYFAIKGSNFDGHDFVMNALQMGAAGAVVKNSWCENEKNKKFPLLRVNDPLVALQMAAMNYRSSTSAKIIAVTGSCGKTTVKEMIVQILSPVINISKSEGNYNNHIGLPISILSMDSTAVYGVFEVGVNHVGEMDVLCRILKPDWGIVTTVAPVHTEFFKTEENIAYEKKKLLLSLNHKGLAFIDGDSKHSFFLSRDLGVRCIKVGQSDCNDFQIYPLTNNTFELEGKDEHIRKKIKIPIPGRHNIKNAAMAASVVRQLGIAWDVIIEALSNFVPLPMRWEQKIIDGIKFINDAYNANPCSMKAAIETFATLPCQGKKWLVLGSMMELGDISSRAHKELGEFVGESQWGGLIVIGSDAFKIAESALARGMDGRKVFMCNSHKEIVDVLLVNVTDSDEVLLKASRSVGLEKVIELFEAYKKARERQFD